MWINNIRYADDTVLIAENISALQDLLNIVNTYIENMGLIINTIKTKFMIGSCRLEELQDTRLPHNSQPIERVNKFRYWTVRKTNEKILNDQ